MFRRRKFLQKFKSCPVNSQFKRENSYFLQKLIEWNNLVCAIPPRVISRSQARLQRLLPGQLIYWLVRRIHISRRKRDHRAISRSQNAPFSVLFWGARRPTSACSKKLRIQSYVPPRFQAHTLKHASAARSPNGQLKRRQLERIPISRVSSCGLKNPLPSTPSANFNCVLIS